MTDLRELLLQHVDSASPTGPRDLSVVRRRITRRRRRQVLVSALAVLALAGGVALAVGPGTAHRAEPVATPAATQAVPLPGTTTPPPTIAIGGVTLTLRGPKQFAVGERIDDGVQVTGKNDPDGVQCSGWDVAQLVAQDASTVRVGLFHYSARAHEGCFGTGSFDPPAPPSFVDLQVPLGIPLGGRRVIDAFDGHVVPVIDLRTYLVDGSSPASPVQDVVDLAPGQRAPYVERTWRALGGGLVRLSQGPLPAASGRSVPSSARAVEVRGHPGQLLEFFNPFTHTRCLSWQERPGLPVQLCLESQRVVPLVSELQRLADRLSVADPSVRPLPGLGDAPRASGGALLVGPLPIEVVYAAVAPSELVVRSPAACPLVTRTFVLAEDASSVLIGTYDYLASGSCVAVGEQRVQLARPLGQRHVVSLTDHHRLVPVIRPSDWLDATYLPPAYGDDTFVGGRGREADGFGQRTWLADGGHQRLTLVEGSVQAVTRIPGSVTGHMTVRGHRGELIQVRGETYPARCLRWEETATDVVQLCSRGGAARRVLSDADLVRVAEALRR